MAKDNKSDITPEEIEALSKLHKHTLNALLNNHTKIRKIGYMIEVQAGRMVGPCSNNDTKLFPNVDKASLIKMGIQKDRWIKYIADQILETQLKEADKDPDKIAVANQNYVKCLGKHPLAKEMLMVQLEGALKLQNQTRIDIVVTNMANVLCPDNSNKQQRLKKHILNALKSDTQKTWANKLSSWIQDVLKGFSKTEEAARDAQKIVREAQRVMVKGEGVTGRGTNQQAIASSSLKRLR